MVNARNGPFQHAGGNIVMLTDALEWPMARVDSLGKVAHGGNGSVQLATSMMTVRSDKILCEKP